MLSELEEARNQYQKSIAAISKSRQELYDLRDRFVDYYTPFQIRRMPLEHYALGNDLPENGFHFCYTIEYTLVNLGMTKGATALKYGIYFGKSGEDEKYKYRVAAKWGNETDIESAFQNLKQAIIDLLAAGESQDLDKIIDSQISTMFKGKLLSLFYPDRYLNIFSENHLNHYLVQLNLDEKNLMNQDAVLKREALLNFKNSDPIMRKWSVDIFSRFLYLGYPGAPPKSDDSEVVKGVEIPVFPKDQQPTFIDAEIDKIQDQKGEKKGKKSKKPDYEGKQKRDKKLGDRGEFLVLQMERKRLAKYPLLAKKVGKAKYDYMGYDILSFETDGRKRHIEVKASSRKVGQANFFLSSNEFDKADDLENYWIYLVFDILSKTPKVWPILNPFSPLNKKISMVPNTYRVTINPNKK